MMPTTVNMECPLSIKSNDMKVTKKKFIPYCSKRTNFHYYYDNNTSGQFSFSAKIAGR